MECTGIPYVISKVQLYKALGDVCIVVITHSPMGRLPQGTFLFAIVWSVGASSGNDGRKGFNTLIREISIGPLLERTKSVLFYLNFISVAIT